MATFAAWLQAQLDDRGLPRLAEAARAIGISQSMLSNYLNGKQLPSRASLRKLAAWSGATVAEIDAMLPSAAGPHPRPLGVPPGQYGIITPHATMELSDPRLVGHFFGFVSRWERMTEEERASLAPDEIDIPDPSSPRTGGTGRVDADPARDGGSA